MGRAGYNQLATELVDVAAGSAADGTTYKYFDMREFKTQGTQFVIAGAGTVTITAEATVQETTGVTKDALDANLANLTWTDISTTLLGEASVTASGAVSDSAGVSGCFTFVRYKIVVASSDGTTAYSIRINQSG